MLSERQETILSIVKGQSPITGQHIAGKLNVTRAALRSDLAILTMLGLIDARPKLGYFFTGNKEKDLLSNLMNQIVVGSALSQPVIIGEHASAYDAIIAMFTEDTGTVFVGEDNILTGVVSRKDLLKAAMGNNDLQSLPVRLVMTPASKLICVEAADTALMAAQRMIEYEVDCLPVIDKQGDESKKDLKIIGRISKTNITRLFVECGLGRRS
jgi:CBS domain-containing protein/biotin operon repressor